MCVYVVMDDIGGCGYDGGRGYDGAGDYVFFFLFHTFTEVHFNAVMTIENKITTKKTKKRLISSASTPHTI